MASPERSKLEVPEDVLVTQTGGEAVLLNLESEQYFGLNEVGTRMWQVLSECGSVEEAVAALATEYEVDPAQLRKDLEALVDELVAAGLLRVHSSAVR